MAESLPLIVGLEPEQEKKLRWRLKKRWKWDRTRSARLVRHLIYLCVFTYCHSRGSLTNWRRHSHQATLREKDWSVFSFLSPSIIYVLTTIARAATIVYWLQYYPQDYITHGTTTESSLIPIATGFYSKWKSVMDVLVEIQSWGKIQRLTEKGVKCALWRELKWRKGAYQHCLVFICID